MKLIFLGAPGVGKGTYAKVLADKFGFIHISTGDILRAEIEKDTELGREVAKIVHLGHLVKGEIINNVITSNLDINKNYIFDGYPRTCGQAEFLDNFLLEKNDKIDKVLLFELSYEKIVKRISGRRKCSSCGKDYNIYFLPPKNLTKCDVCKSDLFQRNDDKQEVVENRLKVYEKDTMPLIKYYEDKNLLRKVDSDHTIDDVVKNVAEVVGLK